VFPLLQTEQITIYFGGLAAVKELDFQIREGEIVGLIGPNGSGKSTFFNLITGIYRPTKGQCFFRGESLVGLPPYKIANKGIARTFQNSRLFLNLSVIDHVLIGMTRNQKLTWLDAIFRNRYSKKELRKALDNGLKLLRQFSKTLSENIYKRAADLSQADRRKLEICRALASSPSLLLLDEPSAGMTPEETKELMTDIQMLRKIFDGIGIIIIEHDMMVIKGIADRVVALNYGRKIAEGTFEEVSTNQELLEAYLGRKDETSNSYL